MRILFDQGTPTPLRAALVGHAVDTAYERGWATLGNGALLAAAEAAAFEVFVTTDQQGRKSLPIMPGCSMELGAVRRDSREFAVRGSSCAPGPSSPPR